MDAVQIGLLVVALLGMAKCMEMMQLKTSILMNQSAKHQDHNMVAHINGDLILGGLFSLHRPSSNRECEAYTSPRNVMRVEAMLYAVEKINNESTILPNITLGAEIRDDCYSETTALEESLKFVLNAFGQVGKICEDNQTPPIMGVVGSVSSEISISVASLLRLFRLPQVSFGATSPDLSDRDEYKYFARTVPSDECQAEALFDIINQLDWSAVFLISSSGNYGERIRDAFVRRAKHNNSLCIADELVLGASKSEESVINPEISKFLVKINKTQSVRGVVLLTESYHTWHVLRAVKNSSIDKDHFRWLGSDTWGVGQPLKNVEEIANGAITVALHAPSSDALKDFYEYYRSLKRGMNARNPWFEERYSDCNISKNSTQCSFRHEDQIRQDDKLPYVFDAVYAFAHGLRSMLNITNGSSGFDLRKRLDELSRNEEDLLEYLMKTSFPGKSGRVSFDHNGNGMPRYDIMLYEDEDYKKITMWNEGEFTNTSWFERLKEKDNYTSSCRPDCKVGQERFHHPDEPPCCWKCQPCQSLKEYVDSSYQCKACAVDQLPNAEKTGCELMPTEGPVMFVIVLLTIWGCLGMLSTAFVAFTMYKFYSTPLIMASGRELMLVLLCGIALSFSLGFALLGEPSPRRCVFQRFGSGVFLAVCYSAILVKTNRIARIFRGQHRPAFITPGPQLLITALFVSIQVGISLLASIFGTSSEVTAFYEPDHFHWICRTSGLEYIISISYNVLLLLLCTGYAFLTRKLPANFNEAKLVGITMYTTCVQWICFIPLFYGTRAVYQTSVLLLNSCFNATVLLLGMFGQKVYVVWLRPEKNTRQASNPRGRNGSTTSASGNSIHMDDINKNNTLEKGEEGKAFL